MKRILLHSCCAPCLTSTSERLSTDFLVVPFWLNPNIEPNEEYIIRLENFKNYCGEVRLDPVIYDEYPIDNITWQKKISGDESEPEGGKRCEKCIYYRLDKTAEYAKENGFEIFSTTLTVSPHKNAKMINRMGEDLAKKYGVEFLAADFKKAGGYARSVELSKQYELYRQKYCGCRYSNPKSR